LLYRDSKFLDVGSFLTKSIINEDREKILRVILRTNSDCIEFNYDFAVDAVFGIINSGKVFRRSSYLEAFFKPKKISKLSKTKISIRGKKLHKYPHLSIGRVDRKYELFAIFPNYKGTSDFDLRFKYLENIVFPAIETIPNEFTGMKSRLPTWPKHLAFEKVYDSILELKQIITVESIFWEALMKRNNEMAMSDYYFDLYFQWPGTKNAFSSIEEMDVIHSEITKQIDPKYCDHFFIDIRMCLYAEERGEEENENMEEEEEHNNNNNSDKSNETIDNDQGPNNDNDGDDSHKNRKENNRKVPLAVIWNPEEVKKLWKMSGERKNMFMRSPDKKDEILEAPEIGKVNKYTEYNLYGTSVFRDVWGECFFKIFFSSSGKVHFSGTQNFLTFFFAYSFNSGTSC
jgi:hypothetical protein